MRHNSLSTHIKNIVLLPLTVTVVIPVILYKLVNSVLFNNPYIWQKIIASLLFIFGFSLVVYTIFLFKTKGKGTLAPWNPTKKLVTKGPYRYCRNPMITGILCILIAESILVNSLSILIWSLFFFCINTLYFIFIEEPKLRDKFGASYTTYKNNVPRWIPKFTPFNQDR